MTLYDEVVFLRDPWLFGIGRITSVREDGRLLVEWPGKDGGEPCEEIHEAHDLELADVWLDAQRAVA